MPKKALILSKKALVRPVLLLKNEDGKLLKRYKASPNKNVWQPFSNYYTIDFSDFYEKGRFYFEHQWEYLHFQEFQ